MADAQYTNRRRQCFLNESDDYIITKNNEVKVVVVVNGRSSFIGSFEIYNFYSNQIAQEMCKSCHPICFVDKRSNTMQFVCIGLKISDHDIINAMYLIEYFAFFTLFTNRIFPTDIRCCCVARIFVHHLYNYQRFHE